MIFIFFWEGINFQNIQTANVAQFKKKRKRKKLDQKWAEDLIGFWKGLNMVAIICTEFVYSKCHWILSLSLFFIIYCRVNHHISIDPFIS